MPPSARGPPAPTATDPSHFLALHRNHNHRNNRGIMPKRIFIGSLSVATTDSTINTQFAPFGTIVTAAINRNASGGSLGNANVEYTADQAGTDAIAAKNGTQIDGSTITVAAAR